MDERKKALHEALKAERERLAKQGRDTLDHDLTLVYLETGDLQAMKANPNMSDDDYLDGFELLQAAVTDYEYLCSDYGV